MIENPFTCGLIPAEIAEEALQNFRSHDHQSELIERCFRPRCLTDLEVIEHIKKVVDDIMWKQMMEEFPHAVVNIKSDDD